MHDHIYRSGADLAPFGGIRCVGDADGCARAGPGAVAYSGSDRFCWGAGGFGSRPGVGRGDCRNYDRAGSGPGAARIGRDSGCGWSSRRTGFGGADAWRGYLRGVCCGSGHGTGRGGGGGSGSGSGCGFGPSDVWLEHGSYLGCRFAGVRCRNGGGRGSACSRSGPGCCAGTGWVCGGHRFACGGSNPRRCVGAECACGGSDAGCCTACAGLRRGSACGIAGAGCSVGA